MHGIKEGDFKSIEEIFENNIQSYLDSDDTIISSNYDSIPSRFYNISTWIKNTNLKCWYCSRKFNNPPFFIPNCISYDETGTEYFEVLGNFCKINCAFTYSLEKFKQNDIYDIQGRLLLLYEKMYGQRIIRIPTAPNKEEMLEYGGNMTYDDYEKELERRNTTQTLLIKKFE